MKALSSKKSFSRRRKIIIFVVLFALIGVGVGAYYVTQENQKAAEADKALDRDRKAAETDKSAKKDAMSKDKNASSSEGLPENSANITSDEVQTSSELSVEILSTSQSGGYVNASAKTSGDGTCVFSYTKDGDKPASKQVAATSGKCSSSLPEPEVPYGSVKLTVTFYKDGKKAEVSQNVTIN